MQLWSIMLPPEETAQGDHAAARRPLMRARLVKQGFSWPALLFGPLWLLWHRLWRWLGVYLLATSLPAALLPQLEIWVGAAAGLLLGFEGNGLLRRGLERRGWREIGLIAADSRDAAELRLARMACGGETVVRAGAAGSDTLATTPGAA